MRGIDLVRERLRNQWLHGAPSGSRAPEVVRWLGAVQAQDYGAAKWGVAQRAGDLSGTDLDMALADGSILRTHILRPTWHFVLPADIQWMLRLTAPRVKALMAFGNRESGLDDATCARSNRAIAAALQGGRQLTRPELGAVLRGAGVDFPDMVGLGRLLVRAELDAVVCSGALRGKQHTYALLDERVPLADEIDRDSALAELAGRYFASHGPATVKDFAWWSGLSVSDATAGAKTATANLQQTEIRGSTYWFAPPQARRRRQQAARAHLLPNFDEYTVAYADREPIREAGDIAHFDSRGDTIFNNVVLVDGCVIGTWNRVARKATVHVTAYLFRSAAEDETVAITAAAERYGRFLGLPAEVAFRRFEPGVVSSATR
ncbi:MAG: winged helix DNA-binding domain-containing protein [Candidatus Dormibacter sp.]